MPTTTVVHPPKTLIEEIPSPRSNEALKEDPAFDASFRPVGAMAFFALCVLLGAVIWFDIYFLMIHRI